ncbi:MAG TPA: transposase, partial [Nitrolancea sp.]|nr:transposase [Nitrolancea sp.]
WMPRVDPRGNASSSIRFSPVDCGPCPSRSNCTQAKAARRSIAIRPRDQYEALEARRRYEATEEYVKIYALRAGAESTLSEGARALGLRRTRSIGLARTHLGHVATAVAINVLRVGEWLVGTQRAQTRQSRFVQLMTQPLAA